MNKGDPDIAPTELIKLGCLYCDKTLGYVIREAHTQGVCDCCFYRDYEDGSTRNIWRINSEK